MPRPDALDCGVMSNNFKNWTQADVDAFNAKNSKSHEVRKPLDTGNQPAEPQHPVRDGPFSSLEVQEERAAHILAIAQAAWGSTGADPDVPGGDPAKKKTRWFVHITDYRERLIDEDNLCEKYIVDCLRYCGKIPQDDPATCKIYTTQRKVTNPKDVGIHVEIIEL